MLDPVTWFIIVLFYAPLHYLGPILLVLLRSAGEQRRPHLRRVVVDCSLSMLIGFTLAIGLTGGDRLTWAMGVLLISLLTPYVHILWLQRRQDGLHTGKTP